jgi:protein-disulfide isomerase
MGNEKATTGGDPVKGPAVGATAVNKRFAGIPQSGLALGDPKAPVTLVEFADLQCPFCREATDNSIPTLVDKYVRPGKLRIEFRNFAILGPDSEKAARALDGAAAQGKAWQFLDLWYLNQGEENSGYVTDDFISKIASGVQGLDAAKVVAAANDMSGSSTSVATANTEAQKFGIQQTPSYLLGLTGKQPQQLQIADPNDPALFGQAIDRLAGGQ